MPSPMPTSPNAVNFGTAGMWSVSVVTNRNGFFCAAAALYERLRIAVVIVRGGPRGSQPSTDLNIGHETNVEEGRYATLFHFFDPEGNLITKGGVRGFSPGNPMIFYPRLRKEFLDVWAGSNSIRLYPVDENLQPVPGAESPHLIVGELRGALDLLDQCALANGIVPGTDS